MGLTTIVAGLIFVLSAGLFVGICAAILYRVFKKAKSQGVVVTDGVNMDELKVIAELIKQETDKSKELEVLSSVQKVVAEALAKRAAK